ncbi:PAS domain-containing sensor histidine kinase [Rhodocytophaga rosea]|uniref:histidine kinase n=1 Tax=Rhodocytophaga rosea TaxID=2704465 RepID=A0A6C0GUK3_9BACT|nr:PAS domain-containing sensor histidine kinase [Rhodocytophaga rosea]QHT71537.1 PAS domain-containing sensor histidine kinase [Rhodocytophaga rosea]
MDEGKVFREKQQTLLNTLKEVFELFSNDYSSKQHPPDSNPAILKKIQEYQSVLLQQHQEISDMASYFEALFHQAPVPYLLLDHNHKIVDSNPAATQLLGTSAEKLAGKEISEFSTEEHKHLFSNFFNHFPESATKPLRIKIVTRDENSFLAHVYYNRIYKAENSFQYLTILHTIDESKPNEEVLIQEKQLLQQENAELEKFMYSASHDLRSPMVSIMGVINVARMETQDEQMIVYLNFIEMSVRKLDNFVQDLINLSKNSATDIRVEKIKLRELIHGIFDQLHYIENVKRIRKVIEVHDTAELHSDKERLNVVLSNLLSNAIKYHHYGQEDPFIAISIRVDNQQAVISLQDNGQGIAEEHVHKIFNKFYRASQNSKGSGLGLFIVKETIEKLGGNIQVNSAIGKGTTFKITLPNLLSRI